MKFLLDTHALIFLLNEPESMRTAAQDAIADPGNEVAFSAANVWEIEIKTASGKLAPPTDDVLAAARLLPIAELPISAEHARLAGRLPLHHRDPFDRMLIAQAQIEGMTIVTRDRAFALYGISLLEC